MTLEERLTELSQEIAADVKKLLAQDGNLATLSTTAKTSLVAAINEIFALVGGGAEILDSAASNSTTNTYSANKITTLLAALKTDILGNASAAYDTLQEIQTILQSDDTAISGLLTAVGNRVAFDASQTLTNEQKAQARENIDAASATGVGNTNHNFLQDYITARDSQ
jgi:hypothetical protein